jgi:mannose-1-phosphate guanylyltransferase
MVLAAGLGVRLRPLTDIRAKPAIPVAGQPLIRRIVGWLAAAGVTDVVVNLHHRPESLAAVLGEGRDLGVRVRYSWEPVLLGSAGGPRLALPILGAGRFWLVNGDTLAEVDLAALADCHEAARARITLAVVPNREPEKYGGVRVDAHGRVGGFVPRGPAAAGTMHFTGVQLVDASVFRDVPADRPASTIGGVYDALIAVEPDAIAAYVSNGRFWDIGTVADYLATSRAFLAGEASGAWRGRGARVDPTATLRDTILWDNVSIGPSAQLEGCIVTDGAAVPAGAAYRSSVVAAAPEGGIRAIPFAT